MKIPSISAGEYRLGKTKDCAVRAFANVLLMDYDETEEVLLRHGYKVNNGASPVAVVNAAHELGFKNIVFFGNRTMYRGRLQLGTHKGITLKTFLKTYPRGRFIVLYSRHALAVVDGNVVDTFDNNPNRRVIAVISLKPF
jgi:hypothetical protein